MSATAPVLIPGWEYQPVANHGGYRTETFGLVHHCQVGDGSLYAEFNNPASEASAHGWIPKEGVPAQYLDLDLICWAQKTGNQTYLAVELEGLVGEPLTPSQMRYLAQAEAFSAAHYDFPLVRVDHGGRGITLHCFDRGPLYPGDDAWGGHTCPGSGEGIATSPRIAQHPQVIAMAVALAHPQPQPEEDDMPTAMFGQVPTDGTPVVIAIPPPSGGGANWGPAWFSMGCDFANATVRVAVHNGTSWRLIQSIALTPAGGRSGFALQAGDDKISLGMQAPFPGGTTGWLIEYGQAVAA